MKVTVINPTPKNIRAMKCPAGKKQCYERVSKDLNLYVSITPAGSKSLVYRKYLNETYRELHLTKIAASLDDTMMREVIKAAESKAAILHARINRGENPFDDAVSAKQELTLQDLFQIYFKEHLDKTRKRAKQTEQDFNNWFADWKNRKVSSITRKDVEKLHGKIKIERGQRTANKAVQLGRAILNKAKFWKLYLNDNPFIGISLFQEKTRDRFLSAEEAGKIIQALQALPDEPYGDLRDFVMLSMLTGARKSNLLSMSWNDIDLNAGSWTIPETKNGSSQLVPLGQAELVILTSRRDAQKENSTITPFVFPSNRKSSSGHLIDPKKAWTTFRNRIGITDITLHDLRRSLAATMAANNQNVALIQSALGHRDLKTTLGVYARVNKQAELQAKLTAHAVWFKAAENVQEPADNIMQMQAKKQRKTN